jgi:hypothetical protein
MDREGNDQGTKRRGPEPQTSDQAALSEHGFADLVTSRIPYGRLFHRYFRWQFRLQRSWAVRSRRPWRRKTLATAELLLATGPDPSQQRSRQVLTSLGSGRPLSGCHANLIEVVTQPNWLSLGTVIQAELQPVEDGTRISIAAWPGAQLFDRGESRRVCNEVVNLLRSGIDGNAGS